MKQLDELRQRFNSLGQRDQNLAVALAAVLLITFFYTVIWEPLHTNFEEQKTIQTSQLEIRSWMLNAAAEVRALKSSGSNTGNVIKSSSPVSIVAEQSATTSGLKKQITKIESSGNDAAQIKIDNAAFDQILLWINTLKLRHGISVSSAKIERATEEGVINARLTINRS